MNTPVSRRTLLQAAVAAPAVAALPLARATDASAATGMAAGGRYDSASPRFALAVLPDTQYLFDADSTDPAPLRETFHYLVKQRKDANVAFLTHLGDVTEHGSNDEIAAASQTFGTIDGALPYSVLAGNHDIRSSTDDSRGDTAYLAAFGPQRFAGTPTFAGASLDGYNTAHVVPAGGRSWLVLALDWRLSDGGYAWAQSALDAHPTLPAILTTHEIAFADDQGHAALSDYGQQLWDRLIRRNDQIFLTLNGHFWPPGRTVLTNDAGHEVHVHITNYQDRYYGGAGMIRLYSFDLARNVIDVETFSPWFLARDPAKRNELEAETIELTDDVDRFSLAIDFEARFAGFAPRTPVPARPASLVMPAGTLAYWRFDAEGLAGTYDDGSPVLPGTVARDLTGNGNDLVARHLHDEDDGVLTYATDHHESAPSHASLRFDGGQSPDRGAVLATRPGSPLNAEHFLGGYTIEAFFKLPDPLPEGHAWMGMLSWDGRNGDVGKTQGYSPLEPTCSVNLSPERFLQYVVYPSVQDASPTSWSHALPTGRWMHLAVVNDGRRTVVYIDGSPIVRNPRQPSTGIATTGRPFVIGATSLDNAYDQGFFGWVGDVRIVGKALPPKHFLLPRA